MPTTPQTPRKAVSGNQQPSAALTSLLSSTNLQPLPEQAEILSPGTADELIDAVFKSLQRIYGTKVADLWANLDPKEVRKSWRKGLAGYTRNEILQGLTYCSESGSAFPPVLPEFKKFCRPPIDYEVVFLYALDQLQMRRQYRRQNWQCDYMQITDRALFWATAELAGEMLSSTYEGMKRRWKMVLDSYIAKPDLNTDKYKIPKMETGIAKAFSGPTATGAEHLKSLHQLLGVKKPA